MRKLTADNNTVIVDDDVYEFARLLRWHVNQDGYVYRVHTTEGVSERLLLHRLIARPGDGFVVDHINGDKLDNRRENLRSATCTENARNRAISRTGTKGVHLHKATGKWRAMIKVNGKHRHIGLFADKAEAIKAYDLACVEVHGEFARPNVPVTVPFPSSTVPEKVTNGHARSSAKN